MRESSSNSSKEEWAAYKEIECCTSLECVPLNSLPATWVCVREKGYIRGNLTNLKSIEVMKNTANSQSVNWHSPRLTLYTYALLLCYTSTFVYTCIHTCKGNNHSCQTELKKLKWKGNYSVQQISKTGVAFASNLSNYMHMWERDKATAACLGRITVKKN